MFFRCVNKHPIALMKCQRGALKQNLLAALLVVMGLFLLVWSMLPPSYNTDLTLIGSGKPVVAVVYDNDNAVSLRLIEAFNSIRDNYTGVLEFIVIDKAAPDGQRFLIENKISSANAVYYSAEGDRLLSLYGPKEVAELVTSIEQTFKLHNN